MAIWSVHNRVASVLARTLCDECVGNGYLLPTQEQVDEMVCGANICTECNGSGLNLPEPEVLSLIKEVLGQK